MRSWKDLQEHRDRRCSFLVCRICSKRVHSVHMKAADVGLLGPAGLNVPSVPLDKLTCCRVVCAGARCMVAYRFPVGTSSNGSCYMAECFNNARHITFPDCGGGVLQ